MSTLDPDELLDVAGELARGKTEAHWRRAISTAYYAVFHLLIRDAAAVIGGVDPATRAFVSRAFAHTAMKGVCAAFESKKLPELTTAHFPALKQAIPETLVDVAGAFVRLQAARHDADYATHEFPWTTTVGLTNVADARAAVAKWRSFCVDARTNRASKEARDVFLVSLALSATINKRG